MATLSSWAYARLRVRQAKPGQRVRLGAVITAQGGSVFNLTHRLGTYGRTSDRMAAPYFAWANYATPPFEHDTAVAGAAMCSEPRFAFGESPRGVILLCNDDGTLVERVSYDDGYTWAEAETRIGLATHPDILMTRGGTLIEAGYRSGDLPAIRQSPAGATPSSEFFLQDDTATDLAFEDDVFRLVEDARGWIWLHGRPSGEGETRLYFSTDLDTGPSATFAVTSGAVTGLASGENPGLCVAPGGTLYAWARIGTSGWLSRRAPGDADWSAFVEMEDDAGDPLIFEAQPFSIAGAFEGPDRLILAAVMDGEALPSEWWSADAGVSWTRFTEA